MGNERKSSVHDIVEEEPIVKSISAQELYIICTQSNEYLLLVDARTEEEYQAGHITSSISLVILYVNGLFIESFRREGS